MGKLITILAIVAAFVAGTIVTGTAVDAAQGDSQGKPFQELAQNLFSVDSFFDVFYEINLNSEQCPNPGEIPKLSSDLSSVECSRDFQVDSFFDIVYTIERDTEQLREDLDSHIEADQDLDPENELQTLSCANETAIKESIPSFQVTEGCEMDASVTAHRTSPYRTDPQTFQVVVTNEGTDEFNFIQTKGELHDGNRFNAILFATTEDGNCSHSKIPSKFLLTFTCDIIGLGPGESTIILVEGRNLWDSEPLDVEIFPNPPELSEFHSNNKARAR